jgi:hypothetical protein
MSWTENTNLASLVVAEDAKTQYTTYERLCYHLVHSHGLPDWVVVQRFQVELESMHDKACCNKDGHTHAKPIRICGYEPKERT